MWKATINAILYINNSAVLRRCIKNEKIHKQHGIVHKFPVSLHLNNIFTRLYFSVKETFISFKNIRNKDASRYITITQYDWW